MNRVESQMAELCGLARRMDGLVPDTAALLREVADTLGQLKVENAKLRELVEAMPYCMEGKCLKCPLCSCVEPAIGDVPECKALPMLYALGISGDDEDKLGVTPF